MAANGASATSRRSRRGVREENFASSSDLCVVHDGDLKDDVAPRCFCGVYAIMYMSRTISNLNRVFLVAHSIRKTNRIASFFFGLMSILLELEAVVASLIKDLWLRKRQKLLKRKRDFVKNGCTGGEGYCAREEKKPISLLCCYNCMCSCDCFLCI
ncbi:uncharacterized protein LOC110269569 [Arachis ipaensis]|uniref:uncharacterized protein LOC110269569 n=1 Tax=Arachis ipaensis TaxID=130454 RepID=UPI000A2B9525|nr:uncharacterized protein LOC110269569 [Arachis ipaensis]